MTYNDFMNTINMETKVVVCDEEGVVKSATTPAEYTDNIQATVEYFEAIGQDAVEVWLKPIKKEGGVL